MQLMSKTIFILVLLLLGCILIVAGFTGSGFFRFKAWFCAFLGSALIGVGLYFG